MECLKGYVGIKGCSTADEPVSGLYVNELPGINLKSIVQIADGDQKTYLKVWADVQKRALRRFSVMLTAYFKTQYKIKLLFDRIRVGESLDYSNIQPMADQWKGIRISINPNSDMPKVSPFITVCFTNMQFYSATSQAGVKFAIFNNQTIIKEYVRDLEQGLNDLKFEYCIPANEIMTESGIAVDANTVETVEASIGDAGGCGSCSCSISNCCSGNISGVIRDNVTKLWTIQENNAHGFRGFVSMECKYDGLVCANKDVFASALWYLLGEEMMIERIYSDTINKYTTVGLKEAKELRDYYKEQVAEELTHVTEGIDLNRGDCCLECNDQVQEVPTIG